MRSERIQLACGHCGKPRTTTPYRFNRGQDKYCDRKCYGAHKRSQSVLGRFRRAGGHWEVVLTKGAVAKVCDCHVHLVKDSPWHYVQGYASNRRSYMHHIVLPRRPEYDCDHINGDKLDNRCSNLRYATTPQNIWNTPRRADKRSSEYKGVYPTSSGSWRARATRNGTRIGLGCYPTPELAAAAYDAFVSRHDGAFAVLNFSEGSR